MTSGMPEFPAALEPTRSRRGWRIVAVVAVIVAGAGIGWWQQANAKDADALPARATVSVDDSSARAPAGMRVRVRVVNATTTRGLARRATLLLRDFGYDVVDFDTDAKRRDVTLVQVHTGDPSVGARIARVLGVGIIATVPDSLRYLDLTVFIGRDWQPPTQPLRP